jgi:RNA recognition motif-containing protein
MSKTVFAGNIAYDVSEEQLIGIFGQVGRVVSFRYVYNLEQKSESIYIHSRRGPD